MNSWAWAAAMVIGVTSVVGAAPAMDARLATPPRTLHEGSGFVPPSDKSAWDHRAQWVREQVLLAAGLWPLPEKTPLNAVIHGKVDRGDYTVEKVYFESYPGFYVSGNLYRPKGSGPFPAVLSPHGHWNNGRLYRAPDKEIDRQLAAGEEKDRVAATYPMQARCANLAKLGCIVFFYDMVGYADSDAERFPHRGTFLTVADQMWGRGVLGLQTWDSIRAMDFLLSLPDVDKERTGCTGASGGATQTFLLMAADPRLKVAAPTCMISAGEHQGGCVCENSPHLRVGTDNVEIAATFAPKPLWHTTATGDWTAHFMEQGYPQIKAVYKLEGAEDNFGAVRYTAPHNYNVHSREAVYNWFNKHFKLGHEGTIKEQKFEAFEPKDLSVWDASHQRSASAVDQDGLRKYLEEVDRKQMEELRGRPEEYRRVMGLAVKHLLHTELPAFADVGVKPAGEDKGPGFKVEKLVLSRESGEVVPAALYTPDKGDVKGATVVVIDTGKDGLLNNRGRPGDLLAGLFKKGQAVLGVDVFMTGDAVPAGGWALGRNPETEFFAGYNRTLIANRAHDALAAVAYARGKFGDDKVNLVGVGKAGAWCLLARAAAGDRIGRVVVDGEGLDAVDFGKVTSAADENYLPGALHYGGLPGLAAVGTGEVLVWGQGGKPFDDACKRVGGKVERVDTLKKAAEWVGR